MQLALILDFSFGEDAAALCEQLRAQDGIERIMEMIAHPEPLIHQTALLILGNLSTDAVDPRAYLTKARLKQLDGFPKLIPHIFSEQALTVAYALGALQNTCTDIEYVAHMQQSGAIVRLQCAGQWPRTLAKAQALGRWLTHTSLHTPACTHHPLRASLHLSAYASACAPASTHPHRTAHIELIANFKAQTHHGVAGIRLHQAASGRTRPHLVTSDHITPHHTPRRSLTELPFLVAAGT